MTRPLTPREPLQPVGYEPQSPTYDHLTGEYQPTGHPSDAREELRKEVPINMDGFSALFRLHMNNGFSLENTLEFITDVWGEWGDELALTWITNTRNQITTIMDSHREQGIPNFATQSLIEKQFGFEVMDFLGMHE